MEMVGVLSLLCCDWRVGYFDGLRTAPGQLKKMEAKPEAEERESLHSDMKDLFRSQGKVIRVGNQSMGPGTVYASVFGEADRLRGMEPT